MSYLLGIDIGTSGTKTGLYNYDGKLVASAFADYPLMQPQVGWVEQNPEDWWQAVKATIRSILNKPGISATEIKGIGMSGQMHGMVLLDKNRDVLRPAIIWADQRTDKQVGWLEENIGREKIIKYTSNPPLPNFTATKILWVKENEPNIYSQIDKILLPKDYIRYKLTREIATDVSDASGTLLLDVKNRKWSTEMMNIIGVNQAWLPKVYESYEITGMIDANCVSETGLAINTPVVAGGGDQAAGAVGNGIVRNGSVSIAIGTSGVVFASTDDIKEDSQGRVHTFCHAVPGKWNVMGVTQAAGGSLQWFRNEFGEIETVLGKSVKRDPYEFFSEEAKQISPGSEGLIFLPYLMGERTPHLDSNAKGTFIGITSRHKKHHFIRAIMEGVSFSLRDNLDIFKKIDVEIEKILVSGGGARSDVWKNILADTFNREIFTISANEGPSFGAALLAGVGINVYSSVEEACDRTIHFASTTTPDLRNVSVYESYYHVYQSLYSKLKETFKALHQLSIGESE